MDSSRSGLLSTLLMTLPLIVVPAIALLRPPGQLPGVSTTSLDASDGADAPDPDDDLLSDFSDLETGLHDRPKSREKSVGIDPEFDDIFAEETKKPNGSTRHQKPQEKQSSGKSKRREEVDPFMTPDSLSTEIDPADEAPPEITGRSAEQIVEQLNAQGALRTMWFEAGPKSPVGFAVFFRGSTELMRYRFEAVGQTRDQCARSVLEQVSRWQAERGQ